MEIFNLEPDSKNVACPSVYSTAESVIELGVGLGPGKTYTVAVNDVTETFVAH